MGRRSESRGIMDPWSDTAQRVSRSGELERSGNHRNCGVHGYVPSNPSRTLGGVQLEHKDDDREIVRRHSTYWRTAGCIQRAFPDFMGHAGDDEHGEHRHAGMGTDRLSVALGTLRGLVGGPLASLPPCATSTLLATWRASCLMDRAGSSRGSLGMPRSPPTRLSPVPTGLP